MTPWSGMFFGDLIGTAERYYNSKSKVGYTPRIVSTSGTYTPGLVITHEVEMAFFLSRDVYTL